MIGASREGGETETEERQRQRRDRDRGGTEAEARQVESQDESCGSFVAWLSMSALGSVVAVCNLKDRDRRQIS